MKWFTEVQIERVEWLWYPYIPFRKLTLLGGDPGMGKSFISQAIAAAVSQGEALPGQGNSDRSGRNVLMLAGEDDPGDTLKPRLISLNADLSRIAVSGDDIRLDADGLAIIRAMMAETEASLFIIDPIVAYLGAKLDMNRSNEVRPMLKGLASIAHDFNAAGLIVRHLRKASTNGSKSKALYAGMGSIDFTAAVRSELQVEEAKNGKKYMNHVKTNIGPVGRSIQYGIEDDEFSWGEIAEVKPNFSSAPVISTRFAKEDDASRIIYDMLKDAPDGLPSNDLYAYARARGISERTMKRAKEGLAVTIKTEKGWIWKLIPGSRTPPVREDLEEEANG
jgi:DNA repair protein RadA/Sms